MSALCGQWYCREYFWILFESNVPVPELICFNSKHRSSWNSVTRVLCLQYLYFFFFLHRLVAVPLIFFALAVVVLVRLCWSRFLFLCDRKHAIACDRAVGWHVVSDCRAEKACNLVSWHSLPSRLPVGIWTNASPECLLVNYYTPLSLSYIRNNSFRTSGRLALSPTVRQRLNPSLVLVPIVILLQIFVLRLSGYAKCVSSKATHTCIKYVVIHILGWNQNPTFKNWLKFTRKKILYATRRNSLGRI
jgi:hypothetical protein